MATFARQRQRLAYRAEEHSPPPVMTATFPSSLNIPAICEAVSSCPPGVSLLVTTDTPCHPFFDQPSGAVRSAAAIYPARPACFDERSRPSM